MPRAKIVSIDANVHGERGWFLPQFPVGMSINMPASLGRVIPDAHSVVAKHDPLAVDGDLGEVIEPKEVLREFSGLLVMIARHEVDLPATNLPPICECSSAVADAKISDEVKNIARFNVGIQAVKDHAIHLFNVGKGTIAVLDDVAVPEMEVRCKPNIRH